MFFIWGCSKARQILVLDGGFAQKVFQPGSMCDMVAGDVAIEGPTMSSFASFTWSPAWRVGPACPVCRKACHRNSWNRWWTWNPWRSWWRRGRNFICKVGTAMFSLFSAGWTLLRWVIIWYICWCFFCRGVSVWNVMPKHAKTNDTVHIQKYIYISEIWLDMWKCEYISRLSKISKPLHGKSCLPPLSPSHQRKVAVGAAAAARLRPSPASCPARQRWEPLVQVRPKQLRSPLDLKLRLDVKAVNVVGIWPLRIIKGFFKHPMYDDILMKHYIDKRRFISWL